MQQLYLTGDHAAQIAERLFTALNVRPVGFRLYPFEVDGRPWGDALLLTPPPAAPAYNPVPCRALLAPGQPVLIPGVAEQIAAPGLQAALRLQLPMLISGLTEDLLSCHALRDALRDCLMSRTPVVVTAAPGAATILRSLTPPEQQLWFDVPEDAAGQSALLEHLLPEAALRF